MFDVLVIGGGHAGVEAASAAVRRGATVGLVTFDAGNLGVMSCNPSIGGLGKGHIVREIDAFDGVMAQAADRAAIHYRMLNRSKGTAVQGPRVQADRRRYAAAVRAAIHTEPVLSVITGEVAAITTAGGVVDGVRLADGAVIAARAVVLATGTFLGAKLFRGTDREEGGRVSERAATMLGTQLRGLGLPMGRLKTGTPPRLDGRTIDWARLVEQPSDADDWTMSSMSTSRPCPQIACAITRTTEETHAIIRMASDTAPLYSGAIEGAGPRYCPSIEDKVHRFGDRDGHQVFLEPEGLDDPIVYPNGLSTSIDGAAQEAMLRSIAGLERVAVTTLGYAVEYDYLDPRALDATLALRDMPGLFCCGQINGTTGYEEAAGQGLVAGLNAAAYACDLAPVVLDRASSYLGVMIDDLVLQGVTEPYRMLTARAEYRLSLRADNAEARLGSIAAAAGCLSPDRQRHLEARNGERAAFRRRLAVSQTAAALAAAGATVSQDGSRRTAWEWLRHDGVTLDQVSPDARTGIAGDIVDEVLGDARYAPYVERQAEEVQRLRADEAMVLPTTLDFAAVPGLSNEMVDRLTASRPTSLAAASRVRGVTPAALSAVLLYARRLAA
jgi:tRNA uridine 5-carboxymethylaminomethyl modification enzyme